MDQLPHALDRELEAVRAARRRQQQLQSARARTAQSLTRAGRELAEAGTVLDRESADVRALEGISLTRFFVALFGDRDTRLERERRELAEAKLRYDERLDATQTLDAELAALDAELHALGDVEARYADVLARREAALRAGSGPAARQLADVIEQLADARADVRELDEAADAGRAALDALRAVRDELHAASKLGTWDMFGGGMLVTYAKHGRLRDAQRAAQDAQAALRRLGRELADLGGRCATEIQIGGALTFADYFFDGLLTDWLVQSRIGAARERVADALGRVQLLLDELAIHRRKADARARELAARRETLLGGG